MKRVEKEQFIFGGVLLLANKFQNLGDKAMPDITLKQWFLLLMISKMEIKSPSLQEIANYTGNTRQNVKQLITVLEEKEYIKTGKSETDSRVMTVQLTEKTFQHFTENEKLGENLVNDLFSGIEIKKLDAVISVFNSLLERI